MPTAYSLTMNQEVIEEMQRKDAKDFMNRHIRWLKANGYSKTFIDARILQLNMCQGATVEGIIERNELA